MSHVKQTPQNPHDYRLWKTVKKAIFMYIRFFFFFFGLTSVQEFRSQLACNLDLFVTYVTVNLANLEAANLELYIYKKLKIELA